MKKQVLFIACMAGMLLFAGCWHKESKPLRLEPRESEIMKDMKRIDSLAPKITMDSLKHQKGFADMIDSLSTKEAE